MCLTGNCIQQTEFHVPRVSTEWLAGTLYESVPTELTVGKHARQQQQRLATSTATTATTTMTTTTAVETLKCENDNTIRHTQATTSRQLMSLQWGATCLRHTYTLTHPPKHIKQKIANKSMLFGETVAAVACAGSVEPYYPMRSEYILLFFQQNMPSFQPAGSLVEFSTNTQRNTQQRVLLRNAAHRTPNTTSRNRSRENTHSTDLKCAPFVMVCFYMCVGFHLNGFCIKLSLCLSAVYSVRVGKTMRHAFNASQYFGIYIIFVYMDWATRLLTFISHTAHSTFNASITEQYCSMITIDCMTLVVTESVLCCAITK